MDTNPSAPLPIPASSSRRSYMHDTSSALVGSPEQIGVISPSRSGLHSFVESPSHLPRDPSRPSFHRSASTVTASQTPRKGDRLSRVQELASTFARSSRHARPAESEWTVFGQLMAEEDAVRTSPSPRSPAPYHSTPRHSSSRSIPEGTTSSYFDLSASMHGVHDPFEAEHSHAPSNSLTGPHHSSLPQYTSTSTTDGNYSESGSDASFNDCANTPSRNLDPPRKWCNLPRLPTLTTVQRNILKCSVAYFIGSLFTFSPYLSGFIADITGDDPGERVPSPSGHMVATVYVVWFWSNARILR